MLTTAGFDPCAVIHSTARTAAPKSVRVVPVHGRILRAWIRTARATPKVCPPRMLATCVPWPRSGDGGGSQSSALSAPGRSDVPLVKSPTQSARPPNSLWLRRMPVSITYAWTPLPSPGGEKRPSGGPPAWSIRSRPQGICAAWRTQARARRQRAGRAGSPGRAGMRTTPRLTERPPWSRQVVAHRQHQQDAEPEDAADHHRPCQPAAVLHMHEEQDDERRLEDGDGQRGDRVERAEIQKGDLHRQVSTEQQDRENRVVDPLGKNVGRHQCACLPIKYRSGKRKIQTISTKCQ